MLDKSLPYKPIIMALPLTGRQVLTPPTPAPGLSLRLYQPGDEAAWAETEAAVLEFPSPAEALAYFQTEFTPWPQLLAQSMVFACDETGTPVANATAWKQKDNPAVPILHWVATRPGLQGKGLGKAVVQQALIIAQQRCPGKTMLLQTQTWSHVAVRLYYRLGFRLVKNLPYPSMKNAYDEAIQVLKGVFSPALWNEMTESAMTVAPEL